MNDCSKKWHCNHVKNIFETGELSKDSTIRNFRIAAADGKVTMLEAKLKAGQEFEKHRVIRDRNYESDFDKEIKKLKKK